VAAAFIGANATGGSVFGGGRRYATKTAEEPFFPTTSGVVFTSQAMSGLASLGRAAVAGKVGGGGDVAIKVENLGEPMRATAERQGDGEVKLTLEPMFRKGLEAAGRSGDLERFRRRAPAPRMRG
jgi:hypothetical protein